ncbi:DUF6123 family protein [Bacillus sp. 165]|uniref:DUF6123 family protein n=1 Tax=Bacillus sp. 165 TaxID=1529117 RepID=UPI001ADA4F0F|nr:DUF6123 family protein [Bacillus sp. 165]MBO9128184.1 hypothetical protein [Bacillus sp. 165]
MSENRNTVTNYIVFLQSKGFKFSEEELGFIAFGQKYTGAADSMVTIAIEATLRHQRHFDGSYYIGLLEALLQQEVEDTKSARAFVSQFE